MSRSRDGTPQWESYLAERTVYTADFVTADNVARVLLECSVTCGGGAQHDGEVCLACPQFVSCIPSVDGGSVRIQCWWHRRIEQPKRWARGSGMIQAPSPEPVCSSCRSDDGVTARRGMEEVYFCQSCADQIEEPIDWDELGAGD